MCSLSVFLCAAHCAYLINNNNNNKLTRRWDSERELSLRRRTYALPNTIDWCIHSACVWYQNRPQWWLFCVILPNWIVSWANCVKVVEDKTLTIWDTDLYKYSSRSRTSYWRHGKVPAKDGDKFRSILATIYLQPIATRGKKARRLFQASTCYLGEFLLVDQHCGNGCSIKCAPLFVSYYNKISGGHIGSSVVRTRCSAGLVLLLWSETPV